MIKHVGNGVGGNGHLIVGNRIYLPRSSRALPIPGCGGADDRQVFDYVVVISHPSTESGECPLSVGSMVGRNVAIWRSNVPDPMTWVPNAFTRVRSFASEV